MATIETIESKALYCPHCGGTHMHLRVKDTWKCMACKRVHDHESESGPAPRECAAQG